MPEYRFEAQAPTLYDDVLLSNPYADNEITVDRDDTLRTVPLYDVPSYSLRDDEHDDEDDAPASIVVPAGVDDPSAVSISASLRKQTVPVALTAHARAAPQPSARLMWAPANWAITPTEAGGGFAAAVIGQMTTRA